MPKDEVYKEESGSIADFKFEGKVVSVFDDMLDRSVPFYQEIQRMICEIANDFAVSGTQIYDLGCSTGTSLLNLSQAIGSRVKFVGIDNSEEMLNRCRQNLAEHHFKGEYDLICTDLNQGVKIENASVVIMALTLQFIRPLYREALLGAIFGGLIKNGSFILIEKVLGEDSLFNRLFIKYYYDLKKRKGYSDLEISQKREALETVLIPYKLLENRDLLLKAGFRYCDVFFKLYNFCGMVAVK